MSTTFYAENAKKIIKMINTFNETELHKTLKILYCEKTNGQTEVEKFGHIYDIETEDHKFIEIQTGNLSKLFPKICDTINRRNKIKVVYPLAKKKSIELYDDNGNLISKTKTSRPKNIYDIFQELTGIHSILLDENFTLEVLEIEMTETRIQTDEKVQSKNGRRRFKKNWLKTGKRLNQILAEWTFHSPSDYINLLPKSLPKKFSVKDLSNALKKEISASAAKNASLIAWVFFRINLFTLVETKGRTRFFEINFSLNY